MTCPCQMQNYGAVEADSKSYGVLWAFLGGFGFLFWLAHKADQYPKRRRS